jgi:hypothetical protein
VLIPGKTFRPYDPELPGLFKRGTSVNRPLDLAELARITDIRRVIVSRMDEEAGVGPATGPNTAASGYAGATDTVRRNAPVRTAIS